MNNISNTAIITSGYAGPSTDFQGAGGIIAFVNSNTTKIDGTGLENTGSVTSPNENANFRGAIIGHLVNSPEIRLSSLINSDTNILLIGTPNENTDPIEIIWP
jgi:hypothetical protein